MIFLILNFAHAKFQVRVTFASMCFFVDNLSGEEEGEEKEEKKPNKNNRCFAL